MEGEGPGARGFPRIGFEHQNGQTCRKYVTVMLTYNPAGHVRNIWGFSLSLGMPLLGGTSFISANGQEATVMTVRADHNANIYKISSCKTFFKKNQY